MINIEDAGYCPTKEEIAEYVNIPAFEALCTKIQESYRAKLLIEYSQCSMEPGWNVKLKKSGKSLCTIYPKKDSMTVLVVVGKKEKEWAEAMLPTLTETVQEIYHETKEGNGQRWLMIPVNQTDEIFEDVLRLADLRATAR